MPSDRLREVPKPLLDDLALGHVVPVVGAGFSRNAEIPSGEMPTWEELAEALAADLPSGLRGGGDAIEVISAYEQEHGRVHLGRRLFSLLHIADARPGRAHRSLVSLPVERIVTTNFDLLLDEALRELRTDFFPVVDETQLTLAGSRRERVLIKAHGDMHHPDRLVLTEDDFDGWIAQNPLMATELAGLFVRGTGLLLGYSLSDPDFRHILRILRDRLGRMARQLYVLLVSPSSAVRARFERRGVKVVEVKRRRSEIAGDAYAELFDEMAALMRTAGVSELKLSQPELGEYLVASAEESPVVFFAVPRARLRPYRDYLFPEVVRLGLVPYSAEEVPAGVPLLSAIEGVIERSVAVVAEPSSTLSRSELAAAVRAGARVLVLRPHGEDLPKTLEQVQRVTHPAPSSEEEWGEFAGWFAQWLRDASYEFTSQLATEPERLLAAGQPRAAVLTGFAFLESALRRQLADTAVPDRFISGRRLLETAREFGVISDDELRSLDAANTLRNELAHTDRPVTKRDATAAVRTIVAVLRRLPA
jgi:hypothetical protein